MKPVKSMIPSLAIACILALLCGCTAIGAATGAVGGAVLTGGNPIGVVGGAAVGGVVGHGM